MRKEDVAVENLSMSEKLPSEKLSEDKTPLSAFNAFQVLGIPPLFDLDLRDVDRAYFDRQTENHPDRYVSFHRESLSLKDIETISADINRAYRILKNPLLRAEELMRLLHIPFSLFVNYHDYVSYCFIVVLL